MNLFYPRETFVSRPSKADPSVVEAITRGYPGADVGKFISILDAFYDDVYSHSDLKISTQSVDAFIGQQNVLSPDEKESIKPIILQVFSINSDISGFDKESAQIQFKPNATSLQPRMAALPVRENEVSSDYTTFDPDPVLPDSKKMPQLDTMDRGGSGQDAAAYSWNMAAYQQANVEGRYPSKGVPPATVPPQHVREYMSTMAGTTTTTNEIYGPRVPPKKLENAQYPGKSDSKHWYYQYPAISGPYLHNPDRSSSGTGLSTDLGGRQVKNSELSINDSPDKVLPAASITIPSIAQIEPVPFLGDFTKFYK